MVSKTDKAIKSINAEANAGAYTIKQTAIAQAMNNTINSQISAYKTVKE